MVSILLTTTRTAKLFTIFSIRDSTLVDLFEKYNPHERDVIVKKKILRYTMLMQHKFHEMFLSVNEHIFFLVQAVGWYSSQPGRSCKHIGDSGGSRGDGEYWIDPENSGNPFRVFCDMTTDGGMFWIVIATILSKKYCICRNPVKDTTGSKLFEIMGIMPR